MSPKVLKHANYRKLYIAAFTSELGLFVSETALLLHVFDLSGEKKSVLGLSRLSFLIFLIAGNLMGGILGAKNNRKHILMFCEFIRIPILALILFTQNPYFIILLSSLKSFFSGIFNPNRQTLVNEIVPMEDIEKANGLFGMTNATLMVIGPLFGAFLYTHLGGVKEIILFDLSTYMLGIYLLSKIRYNVAFEAPLSKFVRLRDFQDTFRQVKNRHDLRALFFNSATAGLCIGILIPLLIPFTKEVLGQGKEQYGLLMGLFGIGGMIGGLSSKKMRDLIGAGRILLLTLGLECVCYILFSLNTNFYIATAIFFVWGILVFNRITNQLNYLSKSVETNNLPKMISLLDLSFTVPSMLGAIFLIFFADRFQVDKIFLTTAIFFFVLIAIRWRSSSTKILLKGPIEQVTRDIQS